MILLIFRVLIFLLFSFLFLLCRADAAIHTQQMGIFQ